MSLKSWDSVIRRNTNVAVLGLQTFPACQPVACSKFGRNGACFNMLYVQPTMNQPHPQGLLLHWIGRNMTKGPGDEVDVQLNAFILINSHNSAACGEVLIAKRSIILTKIYFNAIELFYGIKVCFDKYYRSFCLCSDALISNQSWQPIIRRSSVAAIYQNEPLSLVPFFNCRNGLLCDHG